jgi:hypothetical protein
MNIFKKSLFGIIKKMKFLPSDFYLKIYHEYYTSEKLDLENPAGFNEKIQWIKLYYRPDILSTLVDKYEVRNYIKEKIGEQYLNSIIGVYTDYNQLNFDEFPNQFVLKGVHGSNYNLIVPDKNKLDKTKAKRLINKWLGRNYYYYSGLEWAYKNIKPKILAENFMKEKGKDVLNDYKFFCFNGIPKFVQIDIDRGIHDYRCFYDTHWEKLPFTKGKPKMYPKELDKPNNLDEMLKLAKTLSEPFPFVRVDFFSVNGKTIFGEMTFYPGDGRTQFKPPKYNKIIGDYLTLPTIPENKSFIDTI